MDNLQKPIKIIGILIEVIAVLILLLMVIRVLEWDNVYLFSVILIIGSIFIAIANEIEKKRKWSEVSEEERIELQRKEEEKYLEYGKSRAWWDSFFLIVAIIMVLLLIISEKI